MDKTATVLFDGEVLRPSGRLDLEPNTMYEITIKPTESAVKKKEGQTLWEFFAEVAGTVDAPEDWSAEHDHYIHGSPKRAGRVED
jgi:hypothetical protein